MDKISIGRHVPDMASDVRLEEETRDEMMFEGEKVKPGMLPGVLIGETKVWRNGKQTITEVEKLFPDGLTSTLDSHQESDSSLKVSAWRLLSSFTMTFVGVGAKLLLRGFNTTVVHGGEHLEKALRERGSDTALLTAINHQVKYLNSQRYFLTIPILRAAWMTPAYGEPSFRLGRSQTPGSCGGVWFMIILV